MLKLKGEIHIVPEIAQMPVKVIPNIAPGKIGKRSYSYFWYRLT